MHQHHFGRPSPRERGERQGNPFSRLGLSLSVGTLIGMAVAILLMLLAAAILITGADPTRRVTPIAVTILWISSFIVGFSAQKLYRGSRFFPVGPLSAGIWVATVYLLSCIGRLNQPLVENAASLSSVYAAAIRLISAGLVLFGAFSALRRPTKQVHRRRAAVRNR